MKNVFIVNYKETTIDEIGVLHTECGTCDFAYENEKNAIDKVKELALNAMEECVDELGYSKDDVVSTKNENGDYRCVTCGSNTYEYNVLLLGIAD